MALLRSTLLAEAGFLHAFPTREAPDVELALSLGVERVVQVRQVHGARVALAREARAEADAIVARASTGNPGEARLAVGVRVADCVPVLVADTETGDVAAIHAGWRGVVAGVVGEAVKVLGGRALVAAIGPCIEACCFEVGPEVAAQLGFALCPGEPRHSPPFGSLRSLGFVVREAGGKAFVDLRAAVRAQLHAAGVDRARVDDVRGCTTHDPRFHSFRRDGANSGRMLASIATDPARRATALAT